MSANALKVLPRRSWDARPPLKTEPMDHPIIWVDICHTEPRNILDTGTIRDVQKLHMDGYKMDDIRHNFIVGRDGTVYEGRGWLVRPYQSDYVDVDDNHLDILIISDLKGGQPEKCIFKAINSLMDLGKEQKYMEDEYLVMTRTKYGEGKDDGVLRKPTINV